MINATERSWRLSAAAAAAPLIPPPIIDTSKSPPDSWVIWLFLDLTVGCRLELALGLIVLQLKLLKGLANVVPATLDDVRE